MATVKVRIDGVLDMNELKRVFGNHLVIGSVDAAIIPPIASEGPMSAAELSSVLFPAEAVAEVASVPCLTMGASELSSFIYGREAITEPAAGMDAESLARYLNGTPAMTAEDVANFANGEEYLVFDSSNDFTLWVSANIEEGDRIELQDAFGDIVAVYNR